MQEKDDRHPDRWRKFYVISTVNTRNWTNFKNYILNLCSIRNDTWSHDVKFRVDSAISDLHAADARYHQDCKALLAEQCSDGDAIDHALECVKKEMQESETEMWNSVEIYNKYSEHGRLEET